MRGRPVTIRTVDIGADKALDRMSANELRHEHALNPALGLRAIRWSLSEPAMFRQQLRAILRAAAHGRVRILLPMVAQLSEVRHTLEALARARQQLEDAGRAVRAGRARRHDRGPGRRADAADVPAPLRLRLDRHQRPDPVHPGDRSRRRGGRPPLQPLASRRAAAGRADDRVRERECGKDVSVCGEMAGDPAFTELLLGMGLRSFSMHPSQIVTIKERVLATDASRWAAALERVLGADDPEREVAALKAEIAAPRGGPLAVAASRDVASRCRLRGCAAELGKRPCAFSSESVAPA